MKQTPKPIPSLDTINLIGSQKRRLKSDLIKQKLHKSLYKRLPLKLSSTNFLQLYILNALESNEDSMYGVQIIKKITELYDPKVWKPSNGTIYPLLEQMVCEGLIEKAYTDKIDNKKLYNISQKGIDTLNTERETLKIMVTESSEFFNTLNRELF